MHPNVAMASFKRLSQFPRSFSIARTTQPRGRGRSQSVHEMIDKDPLPERSSHRSMSVDELSSSHEVAARQAPPLDDASRQPVEQQHAPPVKILHGGV